jgi:hypothetical protein
LPSPPSIFATIVLDNPAREASVASDHPGRLAARGWRRAMPEFSSSSAAFALVAIRNLQ